MSRDRLLSQFASGISTIPISVDYNNQSITIGSSLTIGSGGNFLNSGISTFNNNVYIGSEIILDVSSGIVSTTGTFVGNSVEIGSGVTITSSDIFVTGIVTATSFNSTSDIKLKTNIHQIENPIEKVLQINGVSFNWVENNQPSMGVIADDLEKVLPELVSSINPKTVNYNGLIGLLIETVKDQQTQIDSLTERLSKLE